MRGPCEVHASPSPRNPCRMRHPTGPCEVHARSTHRLPHALHLGCATHGSIRGPREVHVRSIYGPYGWASIGGLVHAELNRSNLGPSDHVRSSVGPGSVQGGTGSVHAPHAALKHGHTGPCEVPHASGEEFLVRFRWSHGPHMDRRNTAWTHSEMSHGPRNQWYHVWDPPRTDRDFSANLVVKTRRLHLRVHVIHFSRVHVGSMWSLRVHVGSMCGPYWSRDRMDPALFCRAHKSTGSILGQSSQSG